MAYQGGNLKSTSINGVKMYTVAGQNRSVASWIPPKKLRALRKDPDYLQRVDLIQDLRFETATSRIKVTPDGEYVIASGIYPPQMKVYELRELSLKFERHLISEIINFQVLDDDYSKLAFLCADRSVCLHAKYGSHLHLNSTCGRLGSFKLNSILNQTRSNTSRKLALTSFQRHGIGQRRYLLKQVRFYDQLLILSALSTLLSICQNRNIEVLKPPKTCEICGSIAQNVTGQYEAESTEQWTDESNDGAATARTPAPRSESRNFWRGHRFLNFLLACMVFAFVISWLFHINVPS